MPTAVETMTVAMQENEGIRGRIPAVIDAIFAVHRAAIEDESALDSKTRSLIGFAIAASKRDEGCIAAYALELVKYGATVQEVADAMGVVILMNGGPGHIWGQHALAVFEECAGAA